MANLLRSFNWTVFNHPYFSNLAPSNYHLFPQLKKHLGGQKFNSDDEIQAEMQTFLSSQDPQFYATGIEKLVVRYEKCLNNLGDYVEK